MCFIVNSILILPNINVYVLKYHFRICVPVTGYCMDDFLTSYNILCVFSCKQGNICRYQLNHRLVGKASLERKPCVLQLYGARTILLRHHITSSVPLLTFILWTRPLRDLTVDLGFPNWTKAVAYRLTLNVNYIVEY